MNYYNEIDKSAVRWLKSLISAGLIPDGDVDDRSIKDVKGSDLTGYTQCHFFAGIGGWPFALKLADWPSTHPVWTGSCPCQSLSVAGLGKGHEDERHLWPDFARLICECEPPTVFGEQVASKLGREWLAGVRLDLEAMGYAVGAADLCAAGINAPHIRQRLWWVADSEHDGSCETGRTEAIEDKNRENERVSVGDSRVENSKPHGRRGRSNGDSTGEIGAVQTERSGSVGRVVNTDNPGFSEQCRAESVQPKQPCPELSGGNFWQNSVYIPCGDGKARRIKPGLECLVNGLPGRVAQLRGLGNAIVPQLAAEFIKSYKEITKCQI